jgi:hypothetical protein
MLHSPSLCKSDDVAYLVYVHLFLFFSSGREMKANTVEIAKEARQPSARYTFYTLNCQTVPTCPDL